MSPAPPATVVSRSGRSDSARTRAPNAGLRAPVRRALEDAAAAVLADDASWRWHALVPEEAGEVLSRLVAFVAKGPAAAQIERGECQGEAALALRMATLLRRELLGDPRGLSEHTLLRLVRRIDECCQRIEPVDGQELTFMLTGANALELVVEFAHDLRSPLTSIMFLAETLRKGQSGEINDVQREQLGIMYSAALGMVGIANDLMDLARSEAEENWDRSAEESFSLRELIASVRDMVAPMAEQKRLRVAFHSPQHDTRVGHPVILSRVLLNLLTNAMKFTDQGRVEIVAEERPLGSVHFSVTDTGRGMGPEEIERLYTLFGRSRSRTGFHFSGTGLGLAISRRMVELMGGELDVESAIGEGTRFHFEIKLPRD